MLKKDNPFNRDSLFNEIKAAEGIPQIDLHIKLAEYYVGNVLDDSANSFINIIEKEAKRTGNVKGMGAVYSLKGLMAYYKEEYKPTLSNFSEAIPYYKQLNDTVRLSEC